MKFIKRNKGLVIILILTLTLLGVIIAIFSRMLFSSGKTEYGDRLNNIVKIDKAITTKAKEETEQLEEVEKVTIRIQGKIVYTTIVVSESTKKDRGKEIANKMMSYYDEDIIECYDFEYFVTQNPILDDEGNDKSYTIVGNKHPDKDNISWTKN